MGGLLKKCSNNIQKISQNCSKSDENNQNGGGEFKITQNVQNSHLGISKIP